MNTSELYFNTPVIDEAGKVKQLSDFGGGGGSESVHGDYQGTNGTHTIEIPSDTKLIYLEAVSKAGVVISGAIVTKTGVSILGMTQYYGFTDAKINGNQLEITGATTNINNINNHYYWTVIL